jgi:hypothetical protein
MRTTMTVASVLIAIGVLGAAPAVATPAGPPGPPNQSCQALEPNTPGHAAARPGAPFNEPGINSENGGTGGQHYNPQSQYDVACFQQSH